MQEHDRTDTGWADRPEPKRRIRLVLYGICALLLIAELLVHRHTEHAIEELPAFYALYGFASLVVAVTAAKALRRLVGRNEGYYEDNA